MNTTDPIRVVAVGLGNIGSPLAGRIGNVYPTSVYDLSEKAVQQHVQSHPAAIQLTAASFEHAVSIANVMFTSLPNTTNVLATYQSVKHLFQQGNPSGLVWLDATSGKASEAKSLAKLMWDESKIRYLDCAVSGGPVGASKGILASLIGGDADAFTVVRGVIATFSNKINHLGASGSGHLVKSMNNAMLGAHMLVASEALATLAREGVDVKKALKAINGSSGRSWVTMQRFPDNILTGKPYGFALGMHCKDMKNALSVITPGAAPMLTMAQGWMEAARVSMGDDVDHTSTSRFAARMNKISFKAEEGKIMSKL